MLFILILRELIQKKWQASKEQNVFYRLAKAKYPRFILKATPWILKLEKNELIINHVIRGLTDIQDKYNINLHVYGCRPHCIYLTKGDINGC